MWRKLSVVAGVAALLWASWAHVLDFLDHAAKTFRLIGVPENLSSVVAKWLTAHLPLANALGPWVLLAAAVMMFFAPVYTPMVQREYLRWRTSRAIDAADGWSVAIEASRNIVAAHSDRETDMMGFQQWRFVNISAVRPRKLDVVITIPEVETGKVHTHNSVWAGKTQYQKKIESFSSDKNEKLERTLRFIDFPLELQPSEMVEGQIVIKPDIKFGVGTLLNQVINTREISFAFKEHISGKTVTLRLGEVFNAYTGRIETQVRPSRRKAAKWLAPWLRAIRQRRPQ